MKTSQYYNLTISLYSCIIRNMKIKKNLIDIQTAAKNFSQLGHPRRLEILRLLIKTAPNGLSMGQIANQTNIPDSTLTHHITLLERSGLLIRKQEMQTIYCIVNIGQIKILADFLLKECCYDSKQSCL